MSDVTGAKMVQPCIDWPGEPLRSLVWTLQAWVITLAVAFVVAGCTPWGQQFWRVNAPFFTGAGSWRIWLNTRLVDDWMTGDAFYRNRFLDPPVENPDQRIQTDIETFTTKSVDVSVGAVNKSLLIVMFTGVLWQLSGPLQMGGWVIPRAMVFRRCLRKRLWRNVVLPRQLRRVHRLPGRPDADRPDARQRSPGADDSVVVMGWSGCGKTTLLRVLAELWPQTTHLVE